MNSLNWVLRQQERQFFERKSCFDRLKGKLRPVRAVARDVAETLAAMANADGGALALAVKDDGMTSRLIYVNLSGIGMADNVQGKPAGCFVIITEVLQSNPIENSKGNDPHGF
jgi:hypothetical protein